MLAFWIAAALPWALFGGIVGALAGWGMSAAGSPVPWWGVALVGLAVGTIAGLTMK